MEHEDETSGADSSLDQAQAQQQEGQSQQQVSRKSKKRTAVQKRPPPEYYDDDDDEDVPEPVQMAPRPKGRRMVPVHQSRIADRPPKVGEKDSSLKIKIELDLEVEVEIYARVKGDVTIGLM
jgi:hypothetical protein